MDVFSSAMESPYLVVDNFLPEEIANQMRQAIEDHFGNPQKHRIETHQIWNYWFVPELYTYLKTMPEKIMPRENPEYLMQSIKNWSANNLGMDFVYWPFLSLYVNGCKQEIHNDSINGRFAFVYSLTKNVRKTSGGETIVFHEGDLFRNKLTRPDAGRGFYDLIEPVFNRFVIFDDRMPHGVKRVEGSMDPVEGRFVLHGHICENGPIIKGELPLEVIDKVIGGFVGEIISKNNSSASPMHGPLVIKFIISKLGNVDNCKVLVNRVASADAKDAEWRAIVEKLCEYVSVLTFPASGGSTEVTWPIILGGSLR